MPKVLRIINRFNLGGPTYNATYLTKYLAPEFETLLVGGVKDATEDSSEFIVENLGLKPHLIPEMQREINWKQDKAAYRKLKALMQEFKPDIVHTHASKAGALGRLAAANLKVPAIVHTFHGHVFHSYFGNAKTQVYKSVERYLAKKSHAIIAISEKQKWELTEQHKICSPDKMKVIPLGFDLDRFQEDKAAKRLNFRTKYQVADDELAIGIVGRLAPIKNHFLFLDAVKEVLAKTTKKLRFFIVGDGEMRAALEAHATSLDLQFSDGSSAAPITFTSWIKNVDWVNAGLDVMVLTSKNEGTPVSLIEAQASNLPIVSTLVGGIENIVKPDNTALLSPSEALEPLVENMLRVVEDDAKRKQMSIEGWEFVREKFHYMRLVRDMSNLYNSLL